MDNNGDSYPDEPAAVAVGDDHAGVAPAAPAQSAGGGDLKDNLSTLDADPGHVFDQTNGVVDGLDGDDDGRVDDDSGTLIDPTLDEDQVRDRPEEEGRA